MERRPVDSSRSSSRARNGAPAGASITPSPTSAHDETLEEGRYRLRLVVSGDRLTEVTHFIKIPEAFTRRYASMRSANELIGIGSTVGLAVLYVIGGIGVGMFFMMRRRYVLWRHAAVVGHRRRRAAGAGVAQRVPADLDDLRHGAAALDVPRAADRRSSGAGFVGFSVFFGLSFMAAETLSRRAFGHHPQLWRVVVEGARRVDPDPRDAPSAATCWSSVFFAYDVLLYLVMTKVFGWWSPAEALIHPDVLATYAPWLSAIANSFQAGFWEEALFRAVPIAGAALIGERFGQRKLFIVLGFVVQAIIFGAGHAPYPNQPAYARPVELIIPSIGFGLLYLYFGLLPGIILHFTFDVVWFALPIFLAKAPGIWFQQFMVVALTLVPLWIVLWRRRAGRPMDGAVAGRSATRRGRRRRRPSGSAERRVPHWRGDARGAATGVAHRRRQPRSWRASRCWRSARRQSVRRRCRSRAAKRRARARAGTAAARRDAAGRNGASWPCPTTASGGPHQFVFETAGEARWRELLGVYLPKPRWRVRVATFKATWPTAPRNGRCSSIASGETRSLRHIVPEGRPGATLDESDRAAAARSRAVKERIGLDARADQGGLGQAGETAGADRLDVHVRGYNDRAAAAGRAAHRRRRWPATKSRRSRATSTSPRTGNAQQRAASTRNFVVRVATSVVFGGLLLAAAIGGMMAWSRGQFAPRYCSCRRRAWSWSRPWSRSRTDGRR